MEGRMDVLKVFGIVCDCASLSHVKEEHAVLFHSLYQILVLLFSVGARLGLEI